MATLFKEVSYNLATKQWLKALLHWDFEVEEKEEKII